MSIGYDGKRTYNFLAVFGGTVMLSFVFTEESFRVDQVETDLSPAETELKDDFLKNRYKALLRLGLSASFAGQSPSLIFLRRLSEAFIGQVQESPDLSVAGENLVIELSDEVYEKLSRVIPFCLGAENISRAWISLQFMKLNRIFSMQLREYGGNAAMFLAELSQNLRVPERIFFHLVENKKDKFAPFAFLATYATKDADGGVRHMPLSYALEEYKQDRDKLLSLLSGLDRVAEVSPMLSGFITSGELFHPLRLSSDEAYEFLKTVPDIEKCGIVCRVPYWWKNSQSSIKMQVSLGADRPSMLGFDALLAMQPSLVVDGMELTEDEIRRLLEQTEGLSLLKGKWVEVNHERLKKLLDTMEKYDGQITLKDAMRLESGLDKEEDDIDVGPVITNGKWLGTLLKNLRQPSSIKKEKIPKDVRAELRSYQQTGFQWLCYMHKLGFGSCLADDMGLGKTLQVISFLTWLYHKKKDASVLLIVPASLLGNWAKEIEKFSPSLPFRIMHGRGAENMEEEYLHEPVFLSITTYQMALRMERLADKQVDCLILDEAQAIKNPATKQTRAIKRIPAIQKIAMTGTPIENELTNLWSLFDFINKGLLGSSKEFDSFARSLQQHSEGYQKLRTMISPFILRRLKSDKKIIADLPDKVEKIDYISLSQKQIVLYRKQVAELEKELQFAKGIQRKGLVLSAITKLKQICNHPDQFLGQENYLAKESGKFEVLRTLCETIYEKRERVLIFTQYKEIIPYLEKFLRGIFGCDGLVIHGGVPAKKRQALVDEFNGEDYVPFMILSLKAGGTGLNLTSANHVIHFDRWWNPAVENQATDRAYRIGQNRSVIVHKFVNTGTIEEKIDEMIRDKVELAENVIGGGEKWITEMSDKALLDMMRLEL